jgi:hypothetical protein
MTQERKEVKEKPSKAQRSYYRVRILDPDLFTGQFRPMDVGAKGGLAILLGELKTSGKWIIQSLRLEEGEWEPSQTGKCLKPMTARAKLELASLERKHGYQIAIVSKGKDWQLIPKVAEHWTNIKTVFTAIQTLGMPLRSMVFDNQLQWNDGNYIVYKDKTPAYEYGGEMFE